MKAIIKVSAVFLLGMFLFTSCNSEPTIQEYYVKNQEKSDFIALDLPASLIQLGELAEDTGINILVCGSQTVGF